MVCPDEWQIGDGSSSCRTLDFNLAFSSALLSITPSTCLIVGSWTLMYVLTRRHGDGLCRGGVLLAAKMTAAIVVILADLLAVVGWSTKVSSPVMGTAAVVMAFIASLHVAVLSYNDHKRTVRPHILLSVYLLVILLFDVVRIRTFSLLGFPAQQTFYFVAFVVSFGAKMVLLALENMSKRAYLKDSALKHSLSEEATSGLISQLILLYIYSLLALGRRTMLTNENIGVGEHPEFEKARLARFQQAWQHHRAKGHKHLVWRSLFSALKEDIFAPALACVLGAISHMVSPLLVRAVALFLASWRSSTPQSVEHGWALSAAYFVYPIVHSLLFVWFTLSCAKLAANARALLMQVVYRHAPVRIHTSVAEDLGSGALSSYMTLDINRIVEFFTFPYLCLQLAICYVLGLLIMTREFGAATTVAVLILILANVIGMPLLAARQISSQTLWSKASDARVRLISSIIACFKATKMQGYEAAVHQKYSVLRDVELKQQTTFRKATMPVNFVTNVSVGAFRLAMIVTYATVCYLDPRALEYIGVLVGFTVIEQWGLFFFLWGSQFSKATSAISSVQRIEEFLLQVERPSLPPLCIGSEKTLESEEKTADGDLVMTNASFGFEYKQQALLHNISTVCKAGQLTVILGETSSGKSCLLQAFLGELDLLVGNVCCKTGTLAYCSQDTFLLPRLSILDNIVFSRPFDPVLYHQALSACDLEADLAQFVEGDARMCAALSGGQRQRIALCRALYAQPDTLICDDIFSALDRKTEAHVYNGLFGQNGLRSGKTTILATNALHLVQAAPHLLYLKDGRILMQGNYSRVSGVLPSVSASLLKLKGGEEADDKSEDLQEAESVPADSVEDEGSSDQSTWQALRTHMQAVGALLVISLLLVAIVTWSWKAVGYLFLVRAWVNEEFDSQLRHFGPWIGAFIGTTVAYLASMLLYMYIYILWVPIKASKTLHQKQIRGLLGSAMSYVQDKSVGYLTNRFSSDVFIHETEFSFHSAKVVQWAVFVASQSLVCFIAIPYATIIFMVMLLAGESARRYSATTGRQLRRLESASLTPLFNAIACAGDPDCLRVVRASKMETILEAQVDGAVRFAKQPFYLLAASKQWLFLILSLFLSIMSCVMVLVAVINRTQDNGLLALALISALTIPSDLSSLLIQLTDLQIASVAIHRINAIANLPAEALANEDALSSEGTTIRCNVLLEFKDVTLKYSKEGEPALDRVSFKLPAGRKIGICGRSGSGKSTLLSCLFRLVPLEEGQIFVDGQNIDTYPLYDWRRSLTVIPQEPMLLELTIRENLDLEGCRSDNEIWNVLDKVGCKGLIQALPGQLDHSISHGGLSRGAKQLLALARAILRDSKIVCLDESTASLDLRTDQKITKLLRKELKNATVIVVAHRIETIKQMDEIWVMDKGRIAERGAPEELLSAKSMLWTLAGEIEHGSDVKKEA